MELAEEVPALIPISIALVLLVIVISAFNINYFEKTDAVSMHRQALLQLEEIAYEDHGIVKPSSLILPESKEYKMHLTIKSQSNQWTYGEEGEYAVTVSLPILVKDMDEVKEPGEVTLKIKHR